MSSGVQHLPPRLRVRPALEAARIGLGLGRTVLLPSWVVSECEARACHAMAMSFREPTEWSADLRLCASVFASCTAIEFDAARDGWVLTPHSRQPAPVED